MKTEKIEKGDDMNNIICKFIGAVSALTVAVNCVPVFMTHADNTKPKYIALRKIFCRNSKIWM